MKVQSKFDIVLHEVPSDVRDKVLKWRGRILLNNVIAFFFFTQKDYGNALKYTFEAQSLAVE